MKDRKGRAATNYSPGTKASSTESTQANKNEQQQHKNTTILNELVVYIEDCLAYAARSRYQRDIGEWQEIGKQMTTYEEILLVIRNLRERHK